MEQLNSTPPCLMKAWKKHEHELLCWLLRQVGNEADADDLIQETFLRAIRQHGKFCAIVNARAWLFEVARHLLIDKSRQQRPFMPLHDDLSLPDNTPETVDSLSASQLVVCPASWIKWQSLIGLSLRSVILRG